MLPAMMQVDMEKFIVAVRCGSYESGEHMLPAFRLFAYAVC